MTVVPSRLRRLKPCQLCTEEMLSDRALAADQAAGFKWQCSAGDLQSARFGLDLPVTVSLPCVEQVDAKLQARIVASS